MAGLQPLRSGKLGSVRSGSSWLLPWLLAANLAMFAQSGPPPRAAGFRGVGAEPAPLHAVSEALDLNTATAAQLGALPGMGPVYARRILEGRPYSAKNQLITRGILPQSAYEKIKDDVVAHRARADR